MHLRRLAPVIAVLMTVAACSGGGSSPASSSLTASSIPTATSSDATTVAVMLMDTLRMDPASMTVKVGEPVTFVVTNTGKTEHEFVLGDEADQMAHEASMGGMAMSDSATAISLKPGETKSLTYTFAKVGAFLAGCHEVGHYAGGMKSTIIVTG